MGEITGGAWSFTSGGGVGRLTVHLLGNFHKIMQEKKLKKHQNFYKN